MALSKPTNGSNADYPARVDAVIDVINNGNYPFPATQVPSADANTLDDYEEGTWTPSVGGTATYTSRAGEYTKIGRLACIRGAININAIGTGSTGQISGSPFSAAAVSAIGVGTFSSSATNYTWIGGYINGATINLTALAAAAPNVTDPAVFFQNGSLIYFSSMFNV